MHEIVKNAVERGYLLEPEAMDLLKAYGFPIQAYHFLREGSTERNSRIPTGPIVRRGLGHMVCIAPKVQHCLLQYATQPILV